MTQSTHQYETTRFVKNEGKTQYGENTLKSFFLLDYHKMLIRGYNEPNTKSSSKIKTTIFRNTFPISIQIKDNFPSLQSTIIKCQNLALEPNHMEEEGCVQLRSSNCTVEPASLWL